MPEPEKAASTPRARGYLLGLALGTSVGMMFGSVFKNPLLGLGQGLYFAAGLGGLFAADLDRKEKK